MTQQIAVIIAILIILIVFLSAIVSGTIFTLVVSGWDNPLAFAIPPLIIMVFTYCIYRIGCEF